MLRASRVAFSRAALARARDFKTKASEQAAKQAAVDKVDKVNKGRDPYGLFKSAMVGEAPKEPFQGKSRTHKKHRAEYSREKMAEHHRVNGHFTKLIRARDEAINALPEALQEEARTQDLSLVPIERRVYTETTPIPNFQQKVQQATISD